VKIGIRIETIIQWMVPFVFFWISIIFYLRTYDSCQIKVTSFYIGATTLLCLWLIRLIEGNRRPDFVKLAVVIPLLAYLASGILSFTISPFHEVSLIGLTRRILYVGLILMMIHLCREEKEVKRLLYFVVAAGTVSCLYGLIQFIDIHFYPDGPSGLDPFIWRKAFGSRIFSTHGNPGFYANFLVVFIPLLLGMILKTRSKWLIALFVLAVFNFVVTGDQEGKIGFFWGIYSFILLWILYFSKFNTDKIRKIVGVWIFVAIFIFVSVVTLFIKYRPDGQKFRAYTWLSTWEMILKRPVLGTGLDTFFATYPKYRRPQIFLLEGRHNTETDYAENEYLNIWNEEGIVGLGIYLWLIITFLTIGIRALRRYKWQHGSSSPPEDALDNSQNKEMSMDWRAFYLLGVLSSFIGLLVENIIFVPFRFVSTGIYFSLLIALIIILSTPSETASESCEKVENKKNDLWVLAVKRTVQVLLVCCTAFLCFKYLQKFTADQEFNYAIYYSKKGDWNTALVHYNNINRYNPNTIMSRYFTGNVYNDRFNMEKTFHPEWGDKAPRDDSERSLEQYDKVKYLVPNYVQVHHQVGLVYLKLGEYYTQLDDKQKARESYLKAIDNFEKYRTIDPIFDQNYYRMAYVYIKLGDTKKAEETYLAHLNTPIACNTGPNNVFSEDWGKRRFYEYSETAFNLGNVYYLQNEFKEAETAYSQALNYNPKNVNAWRNLILLQIKLGRTPDAIATGKRALKNVQGNADILQLLKSLGV